MHGSCSSAVLLGGWACASLCVADFKDICPGGMGYTVTGAYRPKPFNHPNLVIPQKPLVPLLPSPTVERHVEALSITERQVPAIPGECTVTVWLSPHRYLTHPLLRTLFLVNAVLVSVTHLFNQHLNLVLLLYILYYITAKDIDSC